MCVYIKNNSFMVSNVKIKVNYQRGFRRKEIYDCYLFLTLERVREVVFVVDGSNIVRLTIRGPLWR